MLIYVRDSEREKIMNDMIKIDEQIPVELQERFKVEEKHCQVIDEDLKVFTEFGQCFLMTNETVLKYNWDAQMLSKNFRDRLYEGFTFEDAFDSHFKLYVENNISINEFIIMLKQRFFDDPSIQLEDIWIYRISIIKKKQSFTKNTYSREKYDCPLFSKTSNCLTSSFNTQA